MGTFTKKKVNIYIAEANTDISSLNASDMIKGEIREYSFEGAEQEFEVENVFGGQIDIVNPRTMATIEFTIRPQSEYAERWEDLAYGKVGVSGTDVFSPVIGTTPKLIVIEGTQNGAPTTWAFNSARNVAFNFDHNADESREATISFSLAPEGNEGELNIVYAKKAVGEFPDWEDINSALDESS